MNRFHLKAEIRAESLKASTFRREATKLIRKGRRLRAESRQESNAAKAKQLDAKGWAARSQGLDLRDAAEAGRYDRRHMHLAAGLLNGRTYLRCEAKCDPRHKPNAEKLGAILAPSLPASERPHAKYIAEIWLGGEARLKDIRERGLDRLLEQDKKQAEITALQRQILRAEQDHQNARVRIASAETDLRRCREHADTCTKALDTLILRKSDMESELRRMKQTSSVEGTQVTCVADLFKDVA